MGSAVRDVTLAGVVEGPFEGHHLFCPVCVNRMSGMRCGTCGSVPVIHWIPLHGGPESPELIMVGRTYWNGPQ